MKYPKQRFPDKSVEFWRDTISTVAITSIDLKVIRNHYSVIDIMLFIIARDLYVSPGRVSRRGWKQRHSGGRRSPLGKVRAVCIYALKGVQTASL